MSTRQSLGSCRIPQCGSGLGRVLSCWGGMICQSTTQITHSFKHRIYIYIYKIQFNSNRCRNERGIHDETRKDTPVEDTVINH